MPQNVELQSPGEKQGAGENDEGYEMGHAMATDAIATDVEATPFTMASGETVSTAASVAIAAVTAGPFLFIFQSEIGACREVIGLREIYNLLDTDTDARGSTHTRTQTEAEALSSSSTAAAAALRALASALETAVAAADERAQQGAAPAGGEGDLAALVAAASAAAYAAAHARTADTAVAKKGGDAGGRSAAHAAQSDRHTANTKERHLPPLMTSTPHPVQVPMTAASAPAAPDVMAVKGLRSQLEILTSKEGSDASLPHDSRHLVAADGITAASDSEGAGGIGGEASKVHGTFEPDGGGMDDKTGATAAAAAFNVVLRPVTATTPAAGATPSAPQPSTPAFPLPALQPALAPIADRGSGGGAGNSALVPVAAGFSGAKAKGRPEEEDDDALPPPQTILRQGGEQQGGAQAGPVDTESALSPQKVPEIIERLESASGDAGGDAGGKWGREGSFAVYWRVRRQCACGRSEVLRVRRGRLSRLCVNGCLRECMCAECDDNHYVNIGHCQAKATAGTHREGGDSVA